MERLRLEKEAQHLYDAVSYQGWSWASPAIET
jgi:hypothetical protein